MTAKELFNEMLEDDFETTSTDMMIAFAKYHIKEFKKQIKDKAFYMCEDDGWDWHVCTDLINELYPLENIK